MAGRTSLTTKVSEIMRPKSVLATLRPCDSVLHAMQVMTSRQIRNLPVVDEDELLGMVSVMDLVSTIVKYQSDQISHMRDFIQDCRPYSVPPGGRDDTVA